MKMKQRSILTGTALLSLLFAANVIAAEAPAEIVFDRMITDNIENGLII